MKTVFLMILILFSAATKKIQTARRYLQSKFPRPFHHSYLVCGAQQFNCSLRCANKFSNLKSVKYKNKKPAIGFQYDSGAAWAVICYGTCHGDVPGKKDNKGGAYYPWGGKELRCKDYDLVYGRLVYYTDPLPDDCYPLGYQNDTKKAMYNAVVISDMGMIPGKANLDLSRAWFPWGNKEHGVRDRFYIIC